MQAHLALLLAEAVLCVSVVLLLFRWRARLGMAPLYLVMGALQYMQFVFASSLRVDVLPGLNMGPATSVLFPATIFVVLLTYVEDDAAATRSLAYGIVICNLTIYGMAALAGQHVALPDVGNPLNLPVALFAQPWRIVAASSLALFVDMIAAVMLFEWISLRSRRGIFVRMWATGLAVMVIDSLVFTTIGFAERRAYLTILAGGLLAKAIGATFYALVIAWYVRTFEGRRQGTPHDARAPQDVFGWLTYRQRYEEVRSLMARDALTGVYNRGYFDEFAPRQLAHVDRARHAMSFVVLDVDHLKATNDRHGHRAGDELVRFIGRELQHMVRASDAACRYGGDEFVVVLTTADAAAARIFADRLLENVRRHSLALEPRPAWAPATITLGIATAPADGRTVEALMHQADARLYEGKRQGGACVVAPTAPSIS